MLSHHKHTADSMATHAGFATSNCEWYVDAIEEKTSIALSMCDGGYYRQMPMSI